MSNIIDIKLKSYDELQFEVITLTTNSYLKDLKIKEFQERIDKAIEYISKHNCIATYEEYKPTEYEYCCNADLLDILKGEKNE